VTVVLIAGLAVAVGALAPRMLPAIGTAEHWASDVRVALLSPPRPQHPDIVIAAITEETLATFPYRSPVDRGFLADLVETLEHAGAKAIGIDVLLDQPTEPAKDERFREVLNSATVPIVVGMATADDQLTKDQLAFLDSYLANVRHGLVNLMTDPQLGTVRWIFPGRDVNGESVPGFAIAIARALDMPTPDGVVALTYRAPPDPSTPPFRTFPAHTVKFLPKSWLANKVVLIGSDLPHSDRHRTPWAAGFGVQGGSIPGVAIHAHALAQLLDRSPPPTLALGGELLLLLGSTALGLLCAALTLPVSLQIAAVAGGLVALWGGGVLLFAFAGLLVPLVAMSISFAVAWAAGNAHWRGSAWRQREFIRQAFSQFTAPAVVDRMIADPSLLRLGGEKRDITSLFTDVAGFTSWFEHTDPQQALAVLNAYLDGMCRVAFEHGGTLDKIIGDALHVIFGAPLDQPDQASRAVRCTVAMHAFSRGFVEAQQAKGVRFGATRIGVHSGAAVVGNFGGSRFFHYTAYGDTVNTASRLESVNKTLGGFVCVSGTTAAQCPEMIFRPIGWLRLYGKEVAIEAFEPVSEETKAEPWFAKYLEAFAWMRDDDARARQAFARLAASYPGDWLIALHAHRLAQGETGALLVLKEK
jgi:adenylate cyclase